MSNEVVPAAALPVERLLPLDAPVHMLRVHYSSIPLDGPDNQGRVLKALGYPDFWLIEILGEVIAVSDVFVADRENRNEETGLIALETVTVLIAPDGSTAATNSEYVYPRLRDAVRLFGPPPWQPPVLVCARQRQSYRNKGQHWLDLDIIGRK